ncbi:hypothetical protein V1477_004027, partial [Vespula maculifrons]
MPKALSVTRKIVKWDNRREAFNEMDEIVTNEVATEEISKTCHWFFSTSTYKPILAPTATLLHLHIFTFYGYHREEEEERERGWKEWGWAFIERYDERRELL